MNMKKIFKKIEKEKILSFFQVLFDFSFSEMLTVRMFPILYFIILAASMFGIFYLCFEAFLISIPRGVFYLFVAAPVSFITLATIVRGIMEFYIVVFRMAESIEEMRIVSDKFTGITDTVEGVNRLTKKLPFWNIVSQKNGARDVYTMRDTGAGQKKDK